MGNKPPSFSNSDNPAADSDSLLTRTLTFFYLPTKNLWLLLCPDTLSFDWSMDAVPLLKTVCDWRNLHTVAFYTGLLLLACYGLKSPNADGECDGKTVTNGKQNANGHSCLSDVEYQNSETKPSFASKVENGIKNDLSQRTQLPSTENIVVLSLSLLIIPFVPATNLFFYVGFVIAERVLYIPSMGFCLLITVGARALYVKVQKRFLKSLIFYATATLIVFYGLKTAIRNGDWQNEEMLYRSGIKVNPAKGVHALFTVRMYLHEIRQSVKYYAFDMPGSIAAKLVSALLKFSKAQTQAYQFDHYSVCSVNTIFTANSLSFITETLGYLLRTVDEVTEVLLMPCFCTLWYDARARGCALLWSEDHHTLVLDIAGSQLILTLSLERIFTFEVLS
ncbi:Protein O-mannosyl-transferase tmtc2 [Saguinus oedipus]|uniref:Protein O-mannosyl-transferase tmtc2 n=1 Tax=Saguinus oedipus TaxID=9490 RepID=A0ABQ9UZY1_SAGOE|nr:Protein O-mannosyl-transferase tmtc2 [Saguinus oedipus]